MSGGWETEEIGYLKPYRTICALCGQLVPGAHWVEDVDGQKQVFCNPAHADLYRSYWLPRHGAKAVGA
jgi:hypothetical protein